MIMERSVAGSTALRWPMPSPMMRPLTRRLVRARAWRASQPSSSRLSTSRRTRSRRSASPSPGRSGRIAASTACRCAAVRSAVSVAMISARRSLRSPRSSAAIVSGRSWRRARASRSLRRPSCGDSRRASPSSMPMPASGLVRRRRGSSARRAWSWAWRCWSISWAMRAWAAQIADLRRSSSSIWSMPSRGSPAGEMSRTVARRARTTSAGAGGSMRSVSRRSNMCSILRLPRVQGNPSGRPVDDLSDSAAGRGDQHPSTPKASSGRAPRPRRLRTPACPSGRPAPAARW